MSLDRDNRQPTPAEYITGSGTNPQHSTAPDSQLLQNRRPTILELGKPLTRDSLIKQHGLDPSDPEVSSLIKRILDLRDIARIKSFLPVIAARHIAIFKNARQNGNGQTPIEKPE